MRNANANFDYKPTGVLDWIMYNVMTRTTPMRRLAAVSVFCLIGLHIIGFQAGVAVLNARPTDGGTGGLLDESINGFAIFSLFVIFFIHLLLSAIRTLKLAQDVSKVQIQADAIEEDQQKLQCCVGACRGCGKIHRAHVDRYCSECGSCRRQFDHHCGVFDVCVHGPTMPYFMDAVVAWIKLLAYALAMLVAFHVAIANEWVPRFENDGVGIGLALMVGASALIAGFFLVWILWAIYLPRCFLAPLNMTGIDYYVFKNRIPECSIYRAKLGTVMRRQYVSWFHQLLRLVVLFRKYPMEYPGAIGTRPKAKVQDAKIGVGLVAEDDHGGHNCKHDHSKDVLPLPLSSSPSSSSSSPSSSTSSSSSPSSKSLDHVDTDTVPILHIDYNVAKPAMTRAAKRAASKVRKDN